VKGYFYASQVKGLTVCAGSDCSQTDSSGYFELKNTPFKGEPVELEVYAGGVRLGRLKLTYNGQKFNPVVLAGGDGRVGAVISAFIHGLGGDEGGFSQKVDLSGVKVKEPPQISLAEFLKGGGEVSVETDDGRTVKCSLRGVEVCRGEECRAVPLKSWAIIYYGAGDNSLSPFIEDDLKEMEEVELPPQVSLVAFVDSRDGTYSVYDYDHFKKELVEIERGEREIDSANVSTFHLTISELIALHPAQHYLVVVSSHGDGLRAGRFVAVDDQPSEILYNWEFAVALKWLKDNGYPVAILGLDQCFGGSSELLYAVRNFVTDGVVASEYVEPAEGWPYTWLEVFADNPYPTPEEVGRAIVDAFKGYYSTYDENYFMSATHNLTLAYYPVNFIRSYSEGIEEFTSAARESPFTKRLMGEVRKWLYPVESYDGYSRVDAYSLWRTLSKKLSWRWNSCLEEDGEEVCQRVKASLEKLLSLESTVYSYHYKGRNEMLGEGLPSIFFPFSDSYTFYFTFPKEGVGYYNPFVESGWPELLKEIYSEGYQITRPDYAY